MDIENYITFFFIKEGDYIICTKAACSDGSNVTNNIVKDYTLEEFATNTDLLNRLNLVSIFSKKLDRSKFSHYSYEKEKDEAVKFMLHYLSSFCTDKESARKYLEQGGILRVLDINGKFLSEI